MKFVWKKEIISDGSTQYRVTVFNAHNECECQDVIYKSYNTRYKRVMYSFMSTYRTTLKEIKKEVENFFIETIK